MAVTEADLDNLFTYHSPVGDQPKRYEMIRAASKQLARIILQTTPVGPDQQAAIRKIREGMMTANAAVACAAPGDFIVEPTQSGDRAESPAANFMMPKYQCHKKVFALKIKEIEQAPANQDRVNAGGDWYLIPEEEGYPPITVGHDSYYAKFEPKVGGYYVVYEDGYKSFSPAKAFEEGYTRIS